MHPPPKSGPHKSGEQGLGSQVFDLADADSIVKHSIAIIILFELYFSYRRLTTIAERKRPLSDFGRGPEKPKMKYEERRAGVCACLCISIVIFEISQVSADDCFAAFCLVNRNWLSHRCSHCLAAARYREADPPERRRNYIIKPTRTGAAVLCINVCADSYAGT